MILKKYFRSFVFAMAGISCAFRNHFNMRFHVVAAGIVLTTAVIFRISPIEWCIILLCIGSVIAAELINTAIELNVDLASPGRNEKAGQSKDIAAAAVLVTCFVSAIIGLIVFIPKFIQML